MTGARMQGMLDRVEEQHRAMVAEKIAAIPPKNEVPVIDNTELVRLFREQGGQLLHVRPQRQKTWGEATTWTRGMTVAFKQRTGRIEIATSIAHRHDPFTKKVGTKTAIEHFNEGKTIFLPIRGKKVVQALQAALSFIC